MPHRDTKQNRLAHATLDVEEAEAWQHDARTQLTAASLHELVDIRYAHAANKKHDARAVFVREPAKTLIHSHF